MTFPRFVVAGLAAVALQVLIWYVARPATHYIDPFLAVAVVSGLSMRRVPALGAGLTTGLARDSLWSDWLGLHGFTKVVVAYAASALGSRLDLSQPLPRILVLALASAVDRGLQLLLGASMGQKIPVPAVGEWFLAAGATVVLGLLAFSLVDRSRGRA